MAKKLQFIKEDGLHSHHVMKDLKNLNEAGSLSSYKNKLKNKIKRIAVIAIMVLITLFYAAARLRL